MLGFSLSKILVFAAIIAVVWYGFKYIGRLQRIDRGERRPGERSMGERLRKATRNRQHQRGAHGDSQIIEDTEKCPKCNVYIAVDANSNCGKPGCPY